MNALHYRSWVIDSQDDKIFVGFAKIGPLGYCPLFTSDDMEDLKAKIDAMEDYKEEQKQ